MSESKLSLSSDENRGAAPLKANIFYWVVFSGKGLRAELTQVTAIN
jgi:hypothetical protein